MIPGATWRILAWRGRYGNGTPIQLRSAANAKAHPEKEDVVVGPSVFDELVIDEWFHLEQMDRHSYWMRVGDVDLWVQVKKDGSATVTVDGKELSA